MDDVGRASAIALSVGAGSLAVAIVVVLLRRTQGVTGTRRISMMARLAASAVRGVLPPRWVVTSMAAGLLAFAGTLAAGVAVTILIERAIPPEVPNPTEVYEGFGDWMSAVLRIFIGAGLSLVVACIVGFVTAAWVASRWGTASRRKVVCPPPLENNSEGNCV
jgi:hypothetical protein